MNALSGGSHRAQVALGIVATLVLTGLSVLAVGALGGGVVTRDDATLPFGSSCTLPNLSGTVVTVSLTDTGAMMDGQHSRMTSGARMFLSADHATVSHGTVSFLAINGGSVSHELVVLPLPEGQSVGARPIGGDAKVSEAGSLGEASAPCGEGTGLGIVPGASSWVTVTLAPGRYELVCNLPGHYAAGGYTELTVT
jgi:uncharacterized cupredoxin-like copper-binding protein